jgi:hypothetical protein
MIDYIPLEEVRNVEFEVMPKTKEGVGGGSFQRCSSESSKAPSEKV